MENNLKQIQNNNIKALKNNGMTFNDKITGENEGKNLTGEKNEKISLSKTGFIQAGKNKGNLNSLRNSLSLVYNSYLRELTGKQNKQTDDIKEQIDETKKMITEVNNQIIHIEKHEIPAQQTEIEDFKNEVEQTRINSKAGFIDSDFNWVKTILFTLFSFTLGISLVLFYTSLIYNGIFKNIGDTLISSSVNDSASLFNTLLDIKSLFTLNTGIIISYLFSSLFLTMGLLLHTKTNATSRWQKAGNWISKAALLLVALGAEIVFAYKIEKNIDEIKSLTMANHVVAQHWTQLLFSVDVLLVIILGFCAYIIWSFALENSFREWNKRNPQKLAAVKINELSRKINRRKYRISEFKKQISTLQGNLNSLNEKLVLLKRKLNLVFFQPVELEERLEAFFDGWLRYINNHRDLKNNVEQHQVVFIDVKKVLLKNNAGNMISNQNEVK